jgi:hypothetical protein
MQEVNDTLNQILVFCVMIKIEDDTPDGMRNRMVDIFCSRMSDFFEEKQKEMNEEKKENATKKKEVVCREVQETFGITDLEIELNKDHSVRVEVQMEKALEIDVDRQGLENLKHAPKITPARRRIEPVALRNSAAMAQALAPLVVPRMIQLKEKLKPTLIAPPKALGSKASENTSKGPDAKQIKVGGAKCWNEPTKAPALQ